MFGAQKFLACAVAGMASAGSSAKRRWFNTAPCNSLQEPVPRELKPHLQGWGLLLELGVGGDLRAVELLEHVEHALQTAGVRLLRGDDRSKGLGATLEAISGKDHLPRRLTAAGDLASGIFCGAREVLQASV